ncbi:MAG: serine O-acetyltransferase [Neomegalonema sp.]|nr:serine O-acetyltransferase [Neomegalonema sp.]
MEPAIGDPIWRELVDAARKLALAEPAMASLVHSVILSHKSFEEALAYRLAQKLASEDMSQLAVRDLALQAMAEDEEIGAAARADAVAVFERDPACTSFLQALLYLKGFLALCSWRIASWYWRQRRFDIARLLQMRISEAFGVDIHPGAKIGCGVMFDHATGIVIGETAVVGDNVSMLHGVTLGGTGKETGDRHPKVGDNVLIGANASILGNITIGSCARIGAGSVVLRSVPPCKTYAGVPAVERGEAGCDEPARTMDHRIAGFCDGLPADYEPPEC